MSPSLKGLLWLTAWIAAVVLFAVIWWRPGCVSLKTIPDDQRVFVLKLPGDGVLTDLIDRGAVLTLAVPAAIQPAPAAGKATPDPQAGVPVAGQSVPLPAEIVRVDHVPVYAKTCRLENEAANRITVCYAVTGVPQDQIEPFVRAPAKVWAWLEKPGKP